MTPYQFGLAKERTAGCSAWAAPHPSADCSCDVCEFCHEVYNHAWQDWTIYPTCESCVSDMMAWLEGNTDYFEMPLDQRILRRTP